MTKRPLEGKRILVTGGTGSLGKLLVKRLLGRGRTDDNETTIRSRLMVYEEETAPLCAFYRERSVLREVNGMGSREKILEDILESLR